MALIEPINEIKVSSFDEFCSVFDITTNMIAGDNGTDEELIKDELNKLNTKWTINFIDTKEDGYFLLQQLFLI